MQARGAAHGPVDTPPIVGFGLAVLGVMPPMVFGVVGAVTGGGAIGVSDDGGAGAGCVSVLVLDGGSVDGVASGGGTVDGCGGCVSDVPGDVIDEKVGGGTGEPDGDIDVADGEVSPDGEVSGGGVSGGGVLPLDGIVGGLGSAELGVDVPACGNGTLAVDCADAIAATPTPASIESARTNVLRMVRTSASV